MSVDQPGARGGLLQEAREIVEHDLRQRVVGFDNVLVRVDNAVGYRGGSIDSSASPSLQRIVPTATRQASWAGTFLSCQTPSLFSPPVAPRQRTCVAKPHDVTDAQRPPDKPGRSRPLPGRWRSLLEGRVS